MDHLFRYVQARPRRFIVQEQGLQVWLSPCTVLTSDGAYMHGGYPQVTRLHVSSKHSSWKQSTMFFSPAIRQIF